MLGQKVRESIQTRLKIAPIGSRLIERSLAAEFGGKVAIEFAPGGVVCRIEAPLDAMRDHAPLFRRDLSDDDDRSAFGAP